MTVIAAGRTFTVESDEIPRAPRVGFTACEGGCALYEFTVDEEK